MRAKHSHFTNQIQLPMVYTTVFMLASVHSFSHFFLIWKWIRKEIITHWTKKWYWKKIHGKMIGSQSVFLEQLIDNHKELIECQRYNSKKIHKKIEVVNYLSVRLMRHRSCCSNLSLSFGCWFCVSTSLRLFPELVEIHLVWHMRWFARTACLARDGSVDVTLVSFENIFDKVQMFDEFCLFIYEKQQLTANW